MSDTIKTIISSVRSIWDREDQWLPPGNYFFLVKKIKSKYVIGTVTNESGFSGEFEFLISDCVKMMATSQASLSRKVGMLHDDAPKYPSPPPTPRKHYPNNYINTVDCIETETENETSEEEKELQNCAICFVEVDKDRDIKYCSKALTCEHQFHRRCLIPWIRENTTCPVCRKPKKTRETFTEVNSSLVDTIRHRYNNSRRNFILRQS